MKTKSLQNFLFMTLAAGASTMWLQEIQAQEIDLEDQLILYLPMDGTAEDKSGMNVPTMVEGPVPTEDQVDNSSQAFLFDGIDDNIILNDNQALITEKQFTICMWARIDGQSQALLHSNTLFEQRDHFAVAPVVIHFTAEENGKTRLVLRSSAENALYQVEADSLGDGSWHFYTALIDADRIMQIYIDGQWKASATLMNDGNFNTGINRVNIGAHHPGSIITGAFNGAIDEVYIYNRALKLCEIETLYTRELLNER
ncbi:MAG: LamG domain-containing protein [Bacteroidetes bacterium]|nr:LamG domain-containing protein [Bacteroidota bacterium]